MDLLDVICFFDWFSPFVALAQDIANGPSYTYFVPTSCGWSGGEVVHVLRERGIHTWGHQVAGGYLMITVSQDEARQGLDLLMAHGLPVE